MKNIPRIYINENLETGKIFPLTKDQAHYLTKVMRIKAQDIGHKAENPEDVFMIFNNGNEFFAKLVVQNNMPFALCLMPSDRPDPAGQICLAFAPIKQARIEEMLAMATQMGVRRLQPVITDRINEHHPKWERIKKIIIESSEQSGRNSVPELATPMKFDEFLKQNKNIVFADERLVSFRGAPGANPEPGKDISKTILIGPEGGFSDAEFTALDAAGAVGISLGKTILRAETAAVAALARLM